GRAALLTGRHAQAARRFHRSVLIGGPDSDARLITPVRIAHQAMQLGIPLASVNHWQLLMPGGEPDKGAPPHTGRCDNKPNALSPRLHAILGRFATLLAEKGKALRVDGVSVFQGDDPFLPGKVAQGLAYWVTEYSAGHNTTVYRCHQFRNLTE